MDCDPVVERDYTKVASAKLRNHTPITIAIVFLEFDTDRFLQNGDAPLPPEIRPLAKDFALEVISELVASHPHNLEMADWASIVGIARMKSYPANYRPHASEFTYFLGSPLKIH